MQLTFSPTEQQAIDLAALMTGQTVDDLVRLAVAQYVEMVFAEMAPGDDDLPPILPISPPAEDLRLFAGDDGTF